MELEAFDTDIEEVERLLYWARRAGLTHAVIDIQREVVAVLPMLLLAIEHCAEPQRQTLTTRYQRLERLLA